MVSMKLKKPIQLKNGLDIDPDDANYKLNIIYHQDNKKTIIIDNIVYYEDDSKL